MKVNLFNDKQVSTIFSSVSRGFNEKFNKAEGEIKNMLDAEVKRQMESNAEVSDLRGKRLAELDELLKITKLEKQIKELSDGAYTISSNGYSRRCRVSTFIGNVDKATKDFNETTEEQCNVVATEAARKVLGIDNIPYRQECMYHDIKARIATMAVSDYDSVVSQLEKQIDIKDYFVTL